VHELPSLLPFLPEMTSCDDLYEAHAQFADVYAAIVERLFALSHEHETVVYAVPGHPWVGEQTTRLILARAAENETPVEVIGGMSFVEPSFAAVQVDLMDGAQIVDAMLIVRQYAPKVEVSLPLLVAQVYARWLASDLKLTLMALYPANHPVYLLRHAGNAAQQVIARPLHDLDSDEAFDHLTSVYLPPLDPGQSLSDLVEIVAHLRAPDGCPWDREQTLATLRSDLLSEAAEVAEAIDADNPDEEEDAAVTANIAEELGDLLLVALMLVQIAAEEGRFLLGDVTQGIVEKLIRRHPHVFGEVAVEGSAQVLANWDAIKRQEKAAKGIAPHPLDGVPQALGALEKARQLQSKARKAKMLDRSALAQSNPTLATLLGSDFDASRLGALLWELSALAAEQDINAEDALREYAVRWRATVQGNGA
jgi:tetrapyrrole methylase family protein/MazG family protein